MTGLNLHLLFTIDACFFSLLNVHSNTHLDWIYQRSGYLDVTCPSSHSMAEQSFYIVNFYIESNRQLEKCIENTAASVEPSPLSITSQQIESFSI